MPERDLIVIGGGLTGLTLAYLLQQRNIFPLILEARQRLGGRIQTRYKTEEAPIEMGATWLGTKHTALVRLLNELDLPIFPQVLGKHGIYEPISTSPHQLVQLPPNEAPSFRIAGGTAMLLQALTQPLKEDQLLLGQAVSAIRREQDGVVVETGTAQYMAKQVVLTLPPFLLINSIQMEPALPSELLNIARETHTWMGESIKVGLTYAEPFWRTGSNSGTIFSNVGPIPEMYDHSNVEDDLFALKGFFNGAYHATSKGHRLDLVLQQLKRYFGDQVANFLSYEEAVWRNEPYTYHDYEGPVLPHQHNGHQLFRKPYWDGKLILAGSETAAAFPGYMEGAVRSAQFVFESIKIS